MDMGMGRGLGISVAMAVMAAASGCPAYHREDPGDALAAVLRASATAGSARDSALHECLDLAEIAGTVSGRGRWVASGSLEATSEGWLWTPEGGDGLRVRVAGGETEVRCDRLRLDPARGLQGDHDVRCSLREAAEAAIEVVSWRAGDELGGSADGTTGGVEVHLTHVGTTGPGETFEAIEGEVSGPAGTHVQVRQTLRRTDDRWGERIERWIEDDFAIGGILHRIDGASITTGTAGWTADGKALRGSEVVARLGAEPGPRVVWTLTATGAQVVIAPSP